MAKDTYKKRMKGHWQQGKGCKGDSEERQYAKREIAMALAADEEGYLERYHKGARTKNERARLEYRINWYQQTLDSYKQRGWGSSFAHYLQDGLRRARKELRDKYGDDAEAS